MNRWELLLIVGVVIPVLKKIVDILDENAAKTPEKWDNILAATFRTVIDVLENPAIFKDGIKRLTT